ncbi:uncharacterized protein CPUR_01322 [Claviceps purpurea 20.1]|uniref:Uncharacterized protein n=1 Tax=Claviceps purpurea (strain 20.1) TaxID=1111077 RepID=M1W6F5_CLAP2|nr:uncharacterized protein CPUR_01322 [Claviceps purpurea 20.1]
MACDMPTPSEDLAGHRPLKSAQRTPRYRRAMKSQHRSLSRLVRVNAKHPVESNQINVFPLCTEDHSQMDRACLRSHIQRDLRDHYNNAKKPACHDQTPHKIDRQDEEGRELAYSDMPLPSDHYRLARRPTLERGDALQDASTSKGRIHVCRQPGFGNDDLQVANLYQMGLLYDAEQEHGSDSFTLNSIRHEEPLYSIRPAKRDRKCAKAGGRFDRRLRLDLSFSDLGEDETLARYLLTLTSAEKADDNSTETRTSADAAQQLSREPAGLQPPLRVVYELAGSSNSFSVDASQPPDLVTDLLSDYDCFSDGELDDTPSQREVQEGAENTPSDTWVILGVGS